MCLSRWLSSPNLRLVGLLVLPPPPRVNTCIKGGTRARCLPDIPLKELSSEGKKGALLAPHASPGQSRGQSTKLLYMVLGGEPVPPLVRRGVW